MLYIFADMNMQFNQIVKAFMYVNRSFNSSKLLWVWVISTLQTALHFTKLHIFVLLTWTFNVFLLQCNKCSKSQVNSLSLFPFWFVTMYMWIINSVQLWLMLGKTFQNVCYDDAMRCIPDYCGNCMKYRYYETFIEILSNFIKFIMTLPWYAYKFKFFQTFLYFSF